MRTPTRREDGECSVGSIFVNGCYLASLGSGSVGFSALRSWLLWGETGGAKLTLYPQNVMHCEDQWMHGTSCLRISRVLSKVVCLNEKAVDTSYLVVPMFVF